MDDIKQRLQETSENCFRLYEAWNSNKKDAKAKRDLEEGIHELRKVASRLEIEIAVNEKGSGSHKPMPIPAHRDSRKQSKKSDNDGNQTEKIKKGLRKSSKNNKNDGNQDGGGEE